MLAYQDANEVFYTEAEAEVTFTYRDNYLIFKGDFMWFYKLQEYFMRMCTKLF